MALFLFLFREIDDYRFPTVRSFLANQFARTVIEILDAGFVVRSINVHFHLVVVGHQSCLV